MIECVDREQLSGFLLFFSSEDLVNKAWGVRDDVGAPPTARRRKSSFDASGWPECKHSSRHMKEASKWCLKAWWWMSSTASWGTTWWTSTAPSWSSASGEVNKLRFPRSFFAGAFLARSRKLAEAMLTAASRQVVCPPSGLPSAVSVSLSATPDLLLAVQSYGAAKCDFKDGAVQDW